MLLRAALSPGRDTLRSVFPTAWITFFLFMLGAIVLVNVIPMTRDLLRGTLPPRRFFSVFLGLPVIGSVGGIVIYSLAKSSSVEHAATVVILILMNVAWVPALRALTAEGKKAREELEGFRKFLAAIEQDPLNRMNQPDRPPARVEEFLAYAIALDVKEARGDHLTGTFFNTITQR